MGDVSIIARRLKGGYVQYGWSGNGGYFCNVGERLLAWYQDGKDVAHLFSLGQTSLIGMPGSENLNCSWFYKHQTTGEGFWLGESEREIFSKIMFIDYGYFYDLDEKWYYIIPGPFRVKMPLELVAEHLDKDGYEFDFLSKVELRIAEYILTEYRSADLEFDRLLNHNGYNSEKVLTAIKAEGNSPLYQLYKKYRTIYEYFDDWILVKNSTSDCAEISEIIVKKEMDLHVETCEW